MIVEPRKQVIAISGWKRSGKSTVADYLSSEHGYVQVHLATPLKQYVREKYNLSTTDVDTQAGKAKSLLQYPVDTTANLDAFTRVLYEQLGDTMDGGYHTPRSLLCLEGATMRAVDPNYWVKQVVSTIRWGSHTHWVIPDLRFQSEISYLRANLPNTNIQIVRIERELATLDTSPSERDLDNYQFQWYISNLGTIPELMGIVSSMLNQIETK